MRFDENELQDLAAFFSRRFPSSEQRRKVASSAGLSDAEGDWGALLQRAQVRGRLGHLADAASSHGTKRENTVLRGPSLRLPIMAREGVAEKTFKGSHRAALGKQGPSTQNMCRPGSTCMQIRLQHLSTNDITTLTQRVGSTS